MQHLFIEQGQFLSPLLMAPKMSRSYLPHTPYAIGDTIEFGKDDCRVKVTGGHMGPILILTVQFHCFLDIEQGGIVLSTAVVVEGVGIMYKRKELHRCRTIKDSILPTKIESFP